MTQIIINSEAPEFKALEKDGELAISEVNMQQLPTSLHFPPCLANKLCLVRLQLCDTNML